MDGIDCEEVLLQSHDSEDRLRAGRREHYDRWLLVPLLESDLHPRHRIALLATVGQLKWPLLLRNDAETLEHVSRDPGERGARVHERTQRLEPFTLYTRDLDGYSEIAPFHCSLPSKTYRC